MKICMKYFGIGLLVLVLAACGNSTDGKPKIEPEAISNEDDGKQVEEPIKDKLTAAELYEKALAAVSEQTSMHITMDVDHNTSVPEHDFNSSTKMAIESSLVFEPFSLHQVTKTKTNDEEMLLDWYATDDVFYLYNEVEDIWFDLPEEDKEEIVGDFTEEIDQFLFLEIFEEFADQFTVEETDDTYTIKLASSGDQFEEITNALIVDEMLAEFEEGEDPNISILDISNITIEFTIAKDTYYTTGFNLVLDVSIDVDGVEMVITQKTKTAVDKLNEIEKVDIPQEVIDGAVEYNEEDYE